MRAGEAFGNDDPDPTVQVTRFPVSLLENLVVEEREAKAVLVTILVELWTLSAWLVPVWAAHTGAQVYDMGPSRSLTKYAASAG